jgi:polysaccharide export outer membrane protein
MALLFATGIPAAGQPAPLQPAGYVLGPEDVLEVTVWAYPDLTRTVVVRPDGRISLPLVGNIQAAGVSVERLTEFLTKAYGAYIITPQVTVIVKEFRKIRVSVLGQVARPGTYALPPGAALLDLLSAAGGATDVADLKVTRLLRPGQEPLTVDVERLLSGDVTLNVPLRGGETLVIAEDLISIVTVVGEVARPGRYLMKGEMRVLDVLLLAGGLTEKASVTQARLVRRSRDTVTLGLDRLLLRQEMHYNVPLQPGDALMIPEETNNRVFVLGDVVSPGVFLLKGDLSLLQAIALAGGPVQRGPATAKSVHIVRRNGDVPRLVAASGAKVETLPSGGAFITVDLQAMLRRGGVDRDVTVQPGDVVVVPQSGLSGMQAVLSIFTGVFWFLR